MQISLTNRIKFSVENIGLQINTDKTETEFANSNHQNQTLRFIRKSKLGFTLTYIDKIRKFEICKQNTKQMQIAKIYK